MTTMPLAVNSSGEAFQTTREEPIQRNKTQTWEAYFGRLGRNISAIAFPMIALVAVTNLSVVNASKFTDCIDNCDRVTEGGLPRMICYGLCALLNAFSK